MRVLYVARAQGGHVMFTNLSPAGMRFLANTALELERRGLVQAHLQFRAQQPVAVAVDVTALGEQWVQPDWLG
jgi:hypothetical protein